MPYKISDIYANTLINRRSHTNQPERHHTMERAFQNSTPSVKNTELVQFNSPNYWVILYVLGPLAAVVLIYRRDSSMETSEIFLTDQKMSICSLCTSHATQTINERRIFKKPRELVDTNEGSTA